MQSRYAIKSAPWTFDVTFEACVDVLVRDLASFNDSTELLNMIQQISFKPVSNKFQDRLRNDIKKINSSDKAIKFLYIQLKILMKWLDLINLRK